MHDWQWNWPLAASCAAPCPKHAMRGAGYEVLHIGATVIVIKCCCNHLCSTRVCYFHLSGGTLTSKQSLLSCPLESLDNDKRTGQDWRICVFILYSYRRMCRWRLVCRLSKLVRTQQQRCFWSQNTSRFIWGAVPLMTTETWALDSSQSLLIASNHCNAWNVLMYTNRMCCINPSESWECRGCHIKRRSCSNWGVLAYVCRIAYRGHGVSRRHRLCSALPVNSISHRSCSYIHDSHCTTLQCTWTRVEIRIVV